MDLLERKLSVLRQQKQLLQQEIADNKELGLKVGCCQRILYSAGYFSWLSLSPIAGTILPIGVTYITVPWFVCLSCSCVVLKWQEISTRYLLHMTAPYLSKDCIKIWLTLANPFLLKFCSKVTHSLLI